MIDAENSQGEIHRRLRGLGMPAADEDNLMIYVAEGLNLRKNLGELERLLQEHEPDL